MIEDLTCDFSISFTNYYIIDVDIVKVIQYSTEIVTHVCKFFFFAASHSLHIKSESLHQYQESPSQQQYNITIVHIGS